MATAHQGHATHIDAGEIRRQVVGVAALGARAGTDAVLEQIDRSLVTDPHLALVARLVATRHLHLQQACRHRHRRPLHQQRQQHDGESDVEQQLRIGHAHHHRHDCQHDRHRAAQADPAHVSEFVALVAEGRQADEHCERTRDQHQEHRHGQGFEAVLEQMRRCHQQAQHHEHARLRQPCQPVHHPQHVLGGVAASVADHHAGQVNRQKTAAVEQVGGSEHQRAAGQDQQRVQALGQGQLRHQPRQHPAARQPQHRPEAELADQHPHKSTKGGRLRLEQHADQRRDQQDGHRIIGAGFDLERRLHALVQAHAAVAQQGEHRRRIGRADDGRQQHAEPPVDVEDPGGKHPEQPRRAHHPPGRQHRRRLETDPEAADARAQATVEQDHRQRRLADQRGDEEILEHDPARPILAGQHAHAEKQQQQRQAEPGRDGAGQHADEQQQAGEEEKRVDSGHSEA